MSNISEAASLPTEAWTSRFRALVHTRMFGLYAALASLAAVSLYVFVLSPYPDFLYNDMNAYWIRAIDRLNGHPFEETQFMAWPPGYHIFLAEFFRVLRGLGLESWVRPETALTINILAFAGSVYAFQRIAVKWFSRREWILAALLLYGFGFPALYFHAFLLADNLAASLLVIAVASVFCGRDWKGLVIAAILFGFASIIRPSIGPYGLAFVIYYFVQWRFSRQFIARAAVFSGIFFVLIAGATAEISRISGSRVQGISISGGLDFFIANSRYYRIDLRYDGWHNAVVVPALSWQPENGRFYSETPYYKQDYYYQLGWEFIKHNPMRLVKNFEHVGNLFFADMLPSRYDAPGFAFFRPVWDWFKFIMLLSLVLYLWLWRALEPVHRPLFGFLLSTIGLTLLVSYWFTGEPRYTYSIIFVFYLLSFKLVEYFYLDWQRWKKALIPSAAIIVLGAGIVSAAPLLLEPEHPPTLRMNVTPEHSPTADTASQQYTVGRILFPFDKQGRFKHASLKHSPINQPAQITLQTNFTITGVSALNLWFDICSTWPYRILIDGRPWSPNSPLNYFEETNVSAYLDPGVHTLEVIVDYTPGSDGGGGFAMSYNYFDSKNWRHRKTLGIDSDRVRFSLPAATSP